MRFLAAVVFAYMVATTAALGQQIIWDKIVVDRKGFDFATSIIRLDSSNYLVGGRSSWAGQQLGSREGGLSLTKINQNGDTIWNKNLGIYGYLFGMIRHSTSKIYAVGYNSWSLTLTVIDRQMLISFDSLGNNVNQVYVYYNGVRISLLGVLETQNHDLLVYGTISPSLLGNSQCDWFVARYTPNLVQKWAKIYNPRTPFACECQATNDFNGKTLLAGLKTDQLSILPIDSNGIALDTFNTLFTNPYRQQLSFVGAKRMPDNGYMAVATAFNRNERSYFIARFNAAKQVIWQKLIDSAAGGDIQPFVNQDGSIVHFYGDGKIKRNILEKLDSSGNSVWRVNFLGNGSGEIRGYKAMAYNPDETAILVGYNLNYRPSGQRSYEDYVFTKVARIGRPFDPVAIPNPVVKAAVIVPYPNPTAGILYFRGLDVTGRLQLYTASGQVAAQYTVLPGQALDLTGLAQGMYYYQLITAGGVQYGKVVVR